MRYFVFCFLFLLIGGCIEDYSFLIEDNQKALVIEATLSDKSAIDKEGYKGKEFFKVKLSETGNVTNSGPVFVSGAIVSLVRQDGQTWNLLEVWESPGTYELRNDDFRAEPDQLYKLTIMVEELTFESEFEGLPQNESKPVGLISFSEEERSKYIVEAGKEVLRKVKGIVVKTRIDPSGEKKRYFRWTFEPTWIYDAPLVSSSTGVKRCWAETPNYLNSYILQEDNVGNYDKELFFLETVRNERLFEKFSVLIRQQELEIDNFSFWEEMKILNSGGLNDIPPFNLKSNFKCINGQRPVVGYFGVVNEQLFRWYFTKKELSYYLENPLKADCLVDYNGPPAPECLDCRQYSNATVSTTTKPNWWLD